MLLPKKSAQKRVDSTYIKTDGFTLLTVEPKDSLNDHILHQHLAGHIKNTVDIYDLQGMIPKDLVQHLFCIYTQTITEHMLYITMKRIHDTNKIHFMLCNPVLD